MSEWIKDQPVPYIEGAHFALLMIGGGERTATRQSWGPLTFTDCTHPMQQSLVNESNVTGWRRIDNPSARKSAPPLAGWIACSERMPEPVTFVLGYAPMDRVVLIMMLDDEEALKDGKPTWRVCGSEESWYFLLEEVTHWMPLPEPPSA
jgi:hypothetical protein